MCPDKYLKNYIEEKKCETVPTLAVPSSNPTNIGTQTDKTKKNQDTDGSTSDLKIEDKDINSSKEPNPSIGVPMILVNGKIDERVPVETSSNEVTDDNDNGDNEEDDDDENDENVLNGDKSEKIEPVNGVGKSIMFYGNMHLGLQLYR